MLARTVFAVRSSAVARPSHQQNSRSMATDAFSSLRSRARGGDPRLAALDEEARKSVVLSLTRDEQLVQNALRESNKEDSGRVRTLVKATINSAVKALYDGADASKLRQINPKHDFDIPAFEPQTMRENLMKRVIEASIVSKVREQLHPSSQAWAWANREGEALTRSILAKAAGRTAEAEAAKKEADSAAASRRLVVEHALKNQPEMFAEDKERDVLATFSATLDGGSMKECSEALRIKDSLARRAQHDRMKAEVKETLQQLLNFPGVDVSKIKQPTVQSNNYYAQIFLQGDELTALLPSKAK